MHVFALGVPLIVAPLGARLLGRRRAAPACVAAGLVMAPTFAFHRGLLAAAWVIPWLLVALCWATVEASIWSLHRTWSLESIAPAVSAAFLAVSAGALLASRMGFTTARISEPIVELTAVHYGFAGFGATLVAASATAVSRGRRRVLASAALAGAIVSPPVVALGFATGWAVPQVGGAAALAVSVWVTAAVTLTDGRRHAGDAATAALLTVAGLAPLAPMVLAVGWAMAQHLAVPALDIPAMERVHGSANALGFVACGLVAYHRVLRRRLSAAWA